MIETNACDDFDQGYPSLFFWVKLRNYCFLIFGGRFC